MTNKSNVESKAEGLRVGNYHETPDVEIPRLQISSVKISGKSFSAISSFGIQLVDEGKMEFKKIPITEAWLIELGFAYNGTSAVTGLRLYSKLGSKGKAPHNYIDVSFSNGVVLLNHTGLDKREYKFVHELQNLCYDLIGE